MKQGILCGLTDKPADFEGTCPDYKEDTSVTDRPLTTSLPQEKVEEAHQDVIARLSEDTIQELQRHQHPVYAVVGGLALSLICALIWAAITISTGFQMGYMAIGVGLLVGFGVRYFGAGIDQIYGILGGFFAVLGCLLGNLFAVIGVTAQETGLSYFATIPLFTGEVIMETMRDSFSPIDLLFYGLAIYEGYKFAFRPVPPEASLGNDLTPAGNQYRMPLTIVVVAALFALAFRFTGTEKEEIYESRNEDGSLAYAGPLKNGLETGEWKYYDDQGNLIVIGTFKEGLQNGLWTWLNPDSTISRQGYFYKGMEDSLWLVYYENGNLADSTYFKYGRPQGPSSSFYEHGGLEQSGFLDMGNPVGEWVIYHENGQLNSKGQFAESQRSGEWTYWYENGQMKEIVNYGEAEQLRTVPLIHNTWDTSGNQEVLEGTGTFRVYYSNDTLSRIGKVADGELQGVIKDYLPNGQLYMEYVVENDDIVVLNSWDRDGNPAVVNENGWHFNYTEDEEPRIIGEGKYVNGLKEELWSYYTEEGLLSAEQTYLKNKLNGESIHYYYDGTIEVEGYYSDDKRVGDWVWYHDNGEISSTVWYEFGKKEGSQIHYGVDGRHLMTEEYRDGELISKTYE